MPGRQQLLIHTHSPFILLPFSYPHTHLFANYIIMLNQMNVIVKADTTPTTLPLIGYYYR